MSGSETDIQWFIARDGKQHGPVSDVELKKLVELSHLKPTDLVWRQGFSDWRNAGSVFPTVSEAAPHHAAPATASDIRVPTRAAPSSTFGSAAPSQTAATQPSYAAYVPQQAVGLDTGKPFAGARAEPSSTRPLGAPPRNGAYPTPGGHPIISESRKPSEMSPPPGTPPPRQSGRGRSVVVVLGLLAMIAAGAWGASRYKEQIFAFIQSTRGSKTETATAAVVSTGDAGASQPAATQAATQTAALDASPAANPQAIDGTLQASKMWVAIKRDFPDWYQARLAEVAHMTTDKKDQTEITRYLVGQLVALRRENAKQALAASTARHKELATAFLANLTHLSKESGAGCYDFISKGESSAAIVSRIENPAENAEIEAQVMAVVAAIVEGREKPTEHAPPVKTDYDVLAGELGRLGWTQADMQLFASPKELAKAPPERVCNMLKDWFTAHLAIQDPGTQERLLFETLKPVVSG
jgi:hypothetical protein